MSRVAQLDDLAVEARLRELLGPLDRHLERGRSLLATALVLSPAPFILAWLLSYIEAKHAAGWSVLAFGVLIVLGLSWEMLLGWVARRRFDRSFPEGAPARAAALRLLAQIETPSKIEEKLRDAQGVMSLPPVRLRLNTDLTSPGQPPRPLLELPPEAPAALPDIPPRSATPRPGGYYDSIPLEPLGSDEEREGRPKG